jgi:hypothetical protein
MYLAHEGVPGGLLLFHPQVPFGIEGIRYSGNKVKLLYIRTKITKNAFFRYSTISKIFFCTMCCCREIYNSNWLRYIPAAFK